MGNCKGPISWYLGNVICYVEQPTSCSDARDSVAISGEKYSALACAAGGKNAIRGNTSITQIRLRCYIVINVFLYCILVNII